MRLVDADAAIDALKEYFNDEDQKDTEYGAYWHHSHVLKVLESLPSEQPERKWFPCSNPPKHHRDVLVRGIEAIGNVTVHKVMQWDVDRWTPMNYPPSIIWKEWSEI